MKVWSPILFIFLCMYMSLGKASTINVDVMSKSDSAMLLADPTIFEHDGVYYAYGTDGSNADWGFRVYRSNDMLSWEGALGVHDGFALIRDEVFGDRGFWAPQVWYENNVFYMAYTANENIAIATSDSPLGPFRQQEKVPIFETGRQIDPFIFKDDSGKNYLFHVRLQEGNRIFVVELDKDYTHVDEKTLKECIHAELQWENTEQSSWPVAEGPTIIRQHNRYYMFYSANDFRNHHYAVGVAVADDVTGPWNKIGDKPLLSILNTNWAGSGHGDAFQKDGQWYYVFHTHSSPTKVGPRRTALIPFRFDHGEDSFLIPVFDPEKMRFLSISNK